MALDGKRATRHNPCPICSEKNNWCLIFDDGGVLCMKTPGGIEKVSKYNEVGWYYPPEGKDTSTRSVAYTERPKQEPSYPVHPLAEIERRDRAYRELLDAAHAELTDEHRENLLGRGVPEEGLMEYGTIPEDSTWRKVMAAHILKVVGDLRGVPGFFQEAGEWTIGGPSGSGIIVPYRSLYGQIHGCQIRMDWEGHGKYKWLSSNPSSHHNGTSCVPAPHHCSSQLSPILWVTEGGLKSQVSHWLSGSFSEISWIGTPGVHIGKPDQWTELIKRVTPRIVLVPDADFRDNIHVYKGWVTNAEALTELGASVRIATWEPELGKGIDDYLLNTHTLPDTMTTRTFLEFWPEEVVKAAWEIRRQKKLDQQKEVS